MIAFFYFSLALNRDLAPQAILDSFPAAPMVMIIRMMMVILPC